MSGLELTPAPISQSGNLLSPRLCAEDAAAAGHDRLNKRFPVDESASETITGRTAAKAATMASADEPLPSSGSSTTGGMMHDDGNVYNWLR